ncbi:MAG: hypothetical protein JWN13_5182 [Betaproteobacteria bacterium]|jgi:hypothetical protein|nr:hypothetical protein [Betaproteobacteria bacterium]MEA3155854.1 hypothetical protein [Betaproteobacteria bacterium]
MKKQRGISLSGLLIASALLFVLVLLGLKIVPVLLEYNAIQRGFKGMAQDPALRGATKEQVRRAFVSRAMVDDIKAVSSDQIEITRDGGELVVSADYDVKVPLFRNVSACFEFHPSSKE